MTDLFLSDGQDILKIAIATVVSYVALLLLIRLMGKRTLAKMNAFDFVVTVTMGSTLSSMLLNKVPVLNGALALGIIIGLQYLLAYLAQRSKRFEVVVNSEPTVLFYNGQFLKSAMKKERITEDEVLSEIRSFRIENIHEVRAVVMEINGTFSVIKKGLEPGQSSLGSLRTE